MSKESYARGFVKAAAAVGVDPVELAKFAYSVTGYVPSYGIQSSVQSSEPVNTPPAVIPAGQPNWSAFTSKDVRRAALRHFVNGVTSQGGVVSAPLKASMLFARNFAKDLIRPAMRRKWLKEFKSLPAPGMK